MEEIKVCEIIKHWYPCFNIAEGKRDRKSGREKCSSFGFAKSRRKKKKS